MHFIVASIIFDYLGIPEGLFKGFGCAAQDPKPKPAHQ